MRTGLPGASKTLNTIADITSKLDGSRPIYYNNIQVLLFDFEVCKSFQGFFYGVWLDEHKHKPSVRKKVKKIHEEQRQVELSDFPYLHGEYESTHDPFELWFKWIRKLYPKDLIAKIDEICTYLDEKQKQYTYEDFEPLNLSWHHFEDPYKWYELPRESIIIIDECQQFFKKLKAGAENPQWAAEFQTHRHKGWDIHLISQKAEYVNYYVRTLTGRHIHYHNPFGGETVGRMEKGQLFNPTDYHDRKSTQQSKFKRPKKFYGVYFSAEIHTHKRQWPTKLLILPVMIIFFIVLMYYIFSKFVFASSNEENEPEVVEAIEQVEDAVEVVEQADTVTQEDVAAKAELDRFNYLNTYVPRVDELPFSAPAYDFITQASQYPQLSCVVYQDDCRCYTQQSTLYSLSSQACKYIALHGYFDPALAGGGEFRRAEQANQPRR